jgi:CheY-like chemotaxis protein
MDQISIHSDLKSILLVDDNYIDIFVNQQLLKNAGATEIVSFNNAHKAINHLLESKTIYQYILVGIYLPLMDGFAFVSKLKKIQGKNFNNNIYFLSCSINPEDKLKAEKMNVKFIEKPLTMDKLLY